MLDSYSPCPCGSGKKFKWCCQPIYDRINHAWEQEANGQHDAALASMQQITKEHESNPEVWGQYARLLRMHNRVDEAEQALEKAFAINPNYPYGLLLRAVFRSEEGEATGALILARRAVEAYDPNAHAFLADAYYLISQCEQQLQHPLAARAALKLAAHHAPEVEEFRTALDTLYGPEGRLPECVRKEYTFRPSSAEVTGPARQAWEEVLRGGTTAKLSDLPRLFEPITQQAPQNAAAWYNLGLSRAWLGDNQGAVEAFNRYLDLEADDARATETAALLEVLRCGAGLEAESDYREHAISIPIRNPEAASQLLNEWARSGRLRPLPQAPEGTLLALLLEFTATQLVTVGRPASETALLAGFVSVIGPMLMFNSPRKESFDRVRDELRQRLSLAIGEAPERTLPIHFANVIADALLFPVAQLPDAAERLRRHAETYYEDVWTHKPRVALRHNTPIDAAAHPRLRKDLLGIIRFTEDCSKLTPGFEYDFGRLRRKLGLLGGTPTPAAAAASATAALDIPAMGTQELGGLDVGTLDLHQLEQAYQAALKLDAQELAVHFARTLVGRPVPSDHADRWPWYSYLMQSAVQEGNTNAALDYVNEGERVDCEHNEGRRRNDYELRRGQLHAKRGEVEAAEDVFRRLIERVPNNLRYRGSAAEAMLSLRQGQRALRFAEEGVEAARHANDRDSEQYLLELAAAAKKQM
jgi:tetratricopeptide (TPR) repeat protein